MLPDRHKTMQGLTRRTMRFLISIPSHRSKGCQCEQKRPTIHWNQYQFDDRPPVSNSISYELTTAAENLRCWCIVKYGPILPQIEAGFNALGSLRYGFKVILANGPTVASKAFQ